MTRKKSQEYTLFFLCYTLLVMEQLGKLFGSVLRVKIMRLFLFQEGEGYTMNEISSRVQSRSDLVKKEMKILESAGFVEYKEFGDNYEEVLPPEIVAKNLRRKVKSSRRLLGYSVNKNSPLISGLHELLIDTNLIDNKILLKYFASLSYIKLLILSGVFVKEPYSKSDIMLVGEKIDTKKLGQIIKQIEAEIGKEIRYSVFTPDEFLYRISMYDKFILDILRTPHIKLIEKMQIPKP